MAGYSGTPVPKKLGIKAGANVALIGAPAGLLRADELPARVTLHRGLADSLPFDVIVMFVVRRAELERQLGAARRRLKSAGGLWIAWPKKSAKIPTDMTDDVIREVALPTGLVDNKVCAIDERWSGLRLVVRLENR